MLDAIARGAQRAEAFVDRLRVALQLERERRALDAGPLAPPGERTLRRFARLRRLEPQPRRRTLVFGRPETRIAAHTLAVTTVGDPVGLRPGEMREQ